MEKKIKGNRGLLSVEAAICLPLFIFFIYALVLFVKVQAVKNVVYEAAEVELAEYMAEYAYLSESIDGMGATDYIAAKAKVKNYVDDKKLIEKYVRGGISGLSFYGSKLPDDDGYIYLYLRYTVDLDIPFIGSYSKTFTERIKQKAYIGYSEKDEEEETDDSVYVYVAENGVVYHNSRRCTYLYHDTTMIKKEKAEHSGRTPCSFCHANEAEIMGFITEDGEKYHTNPICSRLLRNVRRVKKSQVGDLPECQKCK